MFRVLDAAILCDVLDTSTPHYSSRFALPMTCSLEIRIISLVARRQLALFRNRSASVFICSNLVNA